MGSFGWMGLGCGLAGGWRLKAGLGTLGWAGWRGWPETVGWAGCGWAWGWPGLGWIRLGELGWVGGAHTISIYPVLRV